MKERGTTQQSFPSPPIWCKTVTMAYWWYMAVKAESEEAATRFASFFDQSPMKIGDRSIWLSVNVAFRDNSWWGVELIPFYDPKPGGEGVSKSGGAESEEHARLLNQIGSLLYTRLLRAPPFEMALVGVEVEAFYGFTDFADFMLDLRTGQDPCDGLVISEALWIEAERPTTLIPRSDGTYWRPWQGERFRE
jgi:hypothetical protein